MEIANEHRLTEVEARSKSNTRRLDDLEHKVSEYEKQNTTVAILEVRMKAIELKIDTLCAQVESIKAKPAKRWETLTTQIISIIVAAVVGYFIAQAGM
jgi:phage shock protein A